MSLSKFLLLWGALLLSAPFRGGCQAVGSDVPDLPQERWLNAPAPPALFAEQRLTLLDFFGTWCLPCLRALPHLDSLERQFAGKAMVVMVSNEKTAALQRFLQARPGFRFPVLADSSERWNQYFRPPALPYTVVLRGRRVLAITDAASISAAQLEGWLNDTTAAPASATPVSAPDAATDNAMHYSSNTTVRLSQEYLYAAKTGADAAPLLAQLANLRLEELVAALSTDAAKKAFWINVYNGYTQATLRAAPGQYKNRNAFFKRKALRIAGQELSLDEIEHGFLRRSRIKWSLGYLGKPFPSKTEKALRVAMRDYRVHFALNCGAKSCPPVAFYNDAQLDGQLELATRAYLSGESTYDAARNTVSVPKILGWFRADFGGKKGIRSLLEKVGIVPAGSDPTIHFNKYDWTLTLNNYKP